MVYFFVPGSDDFLKTILSSISIPRSWPAISLSQLLPAFFRNVKEMYLFANEGENHTNNVKQLEEMKKGTEDTGAESLMDNHPSNQKILSLKK